VSASEGLLQSGDGRRLLAAQLFDSEAARLLPAASRFVDCCLQVASQSRPAAAK